MKKLIKMYNEKYGDILGIIDDDFNKEQMYRIYYFIKNNCDDKDIQDRLAKIKLDKPKTLEQQLTKLEGESDKSTNLPYVKAETALVNITVDQLNKAWVETQANDDDTTMYIEVPNFTIKDDTLLFIEINNKRYKLDSVYTSDITEQNKTRITMEFYNINDTTNNIMGGNVQTFCDKTEEYNENKALMSLNRINDDKPPIFISGIKLFEISVNKLNSILLGKDVDIYNSLSIQRNAGSKIGEYSTAMGSFTEASGMNSHAEGCITVASGNSSHAEGNSTTASGMNSHAEGSYTKASGSSSHAEGNYTTVSGNCSHVEGNNTKASSNNQHVQGKYNIEDTANKYAHIVGNGTYNKKSNAHTLDWQGNAWYSGKLSQEGTPTENKDLTTKKYVDDKVSSLPQFSFNEAGELVVTINGISKIFVPKSE